MPGIDVMPRVMISKDAKLASEAAKNVKMVIRGYKNTNQFPISVRSGNKSFGLEAGGTLKNKRGEVVTSAAFMVFVDSGSLAVIREPLKPGEIPPPEVKMENEDAPLKNPYHGVPVGGHQGLPRVVKPVSRG
jgi:hypothetical protein